MLAGAKANLTVDIWLELSDETLLKECVFSYIKKNIQLAIQDGFSPYTEFSDVAKTYSDNVLDIFGQRLMKSERADIQSFYDFWEIKPEFKADKYYLLAHTQGMVTTDNFEFLADYKVRKDLSFVTDLANVRSP